MKVQEKSTGNIYTAHEIEGGYEVLTDTGERYKRLKESSFRKMFKEVKPEKTKQAQNKQAQKPKNLEPVKELDDKDREKMIDKIKKILALAKDNPSMEEGLAAALQAQKLMAKYNIHEDDVTLEEVKEEISSVFSCQKHNSHLLAWRKTLGLIVAKNFRCKCYMNGQDIVFRGYTQDAKIALEVYMNLYTIGNRLGTQAYFDQLNNEGSGKGAYNSFVKGFLRGIEEGLGEQCTALMIVVPKEVEEEYAVFSANFKKSKGMQAGTINISLYEKGRTEGKSAIKARSIAKKGK